MGKGWVVLTAPSRDLIGSVVASIRRDSIATMHRSVRMCVHDRACRLPLRSMEICSNECAYSNSAKLRGDLTAPLCALLQFVLDEREAAAAAGGAGRRMGPGQETAALECGGVRGRVGWGCPDCTSQRCFEGVDVLICKYAVGSERIASSCWP